MRFVGNCSECQNAYSEDFMPVYSEWHQKLVCPDCAYCGCHDERQKRECEDFMRGYAEEARADADMDR